MVPMTLTVISRSRYFSTSICTRNDTR